MPDSQVNLIPLPSDAHRPASRRRPLPDAQAISTFSVPDVAPPYDDDADPARSLTAVTQLFPGRHGVAATGTTDSGTAGSDPRLSPGSGTWPSQFAQVLSETLAGSRPASQLTPWTTEQAREHISQLGPMLATSRQPRVRRVIVTSPAHGVLEMTVIMDIGSRSRAVAVRLERPSTAAEPVAAKPVSSATSTAGATTPRRATWLCTAVEAA